MRKIVKLQKEVIDSKNVKLLRGGRSNVSLGCHNISTISLYFCL